LIKLQQEEIKKQELENQREQRRQMMSGIFAKDKQK